MTKRVIAAVTLAFIIAGCSLKNGLEIGPIKLSLPMGGGVLDPSQFPDGAADMPFALGSVEQDICNLPTEDDLTTAFRLAGNIDLSSIIRLSRAELQTTTLRATSGSLRNIKAVQLYFIPKNGSIFGRVNLGGAYSLTGFDDTIEINAPSGVDLLELVRENDVMPGDDCPKLLVRAAGSVPEEPIQWEAELDLDAYAQIGVF